MVKKHIFLMFKIMIIDHDFKQQIQQNLRSLSGEDKM